MPAQDRMNGAPDLGAAGETVSIVQIPLDQLHDFPDHPFEIREDTSMRETVDSVKEYGVLVPAIVRPREEGGYEIVAGHRRKRACELAGLKTMPANLQRENILPSERAKAYKMKLEAIKRQAGRPSKNAPQLAAHFRSDDKVAEPENISGDTVRRYIRLTELDPKLQQMVDDHKMAITPAVELSYLKTGYAVTIPGPAHEETQPGRETQRRCNPGHHDGKEKAGTGGHHALR